MPVMELGDGSVVVANAQVRYRYIDYKSSLDRIRAERESGRDNFFHVIETLRALDSESALSPRKAAQMGLRQVYGHDMVVRYYMGQQMLVRRDMCLAFHHFVIQQILTKTLRADFDAVFEIGAGLGDSIAELAARNPYSHIQFFGGEIALHGLRSLAEFADMLSLKNLHGVDLDISNPDFSFLKCKRNVLVFSQFVMVYVNPFPLAFFERLLDALENVTFVLIEPFSFSLANEMSAKPGFTLQQAQSYGIAQNFWEGVQDLQKAGRIVIDEVVPDIAGKTMLSTVSLARFRKVVG